MGLIKKYVEYLNDNPDGYWFKRKLYGWGWTPARLQGWIILIVYLLFILLVISRVDQEIDGESVLGKVALPVLFATVLLIFLCYAKGERPRWQWGKHLDD